MKFDIPRPKYTGRVNTVTLGSGSNRLPVGGQEALSLHYFDGSIPNPPGFSLDVWDYDPGEDWPAALLEAYPEAVRRDPGLWAKKCVEYGADLVTLHLKSSNPNERNTGPQEAVASVRRVLEEVQVPLIVIGVDQTDKDVETLSAVAEAASGRALALGPLTARNYKRLGAQALVHGHAVVALSPTDFNLAKQLNILLFGLGMPKERIIIDPTAAALGYGMEYCYSVMEQLQTAALLYDDQDVQQPIISFFGEDTWRTKEAAQPTPEGAGPDANPGVMLESANSVAMLAAGASILCLRHPLALANARDFLEQFTRS